MLQITTQQLKDFQTCGRLYDYRYNQQLPETIGSRILNTTKFENTIRGMVHYFFHKKQAGITPSYSSLLNRWEKLWFPKDSSSYDIIYEQHETLHGNAASLTSKAANVLLELIDNFGEKKIIPMGIDEDCIAPINSSIGIKDKFDLIYYKDGKIHILKWMFNYKLKHQYTYVLDFAVMNMGFINKFGNKIDQAKFGYFDLLNQKSGFNEVYVEEADIEAVKYWCESLLEETIFPSRRGLTSYCKVCPFDKPCSKWTSWNKKEKTNGKKRKK
jgi:hypothetical protein